jgi:hypothetical protein
LIEISANYSVVFVTVILFLLMPLDENVNIVIVSNATLACLYQFCNSLEHSVLNWLMQIEQFPIVNKIETKQLKVRILFGTEIKISCYTD